MPNIPGAYLAGQKIPGAVDGTTISGANLVVFGQSGQILVYDGDPATGNLIGSWSGMAGDDSEGNTFPLGLGLQGTGDVFTVIGTNGAEIVVQIVGGLPQIVMETGAANQHTLAGIYSQITNPGASEFLSTFLVGAGVATYTDFATIALNSSAIDGSLTGGGQLSYYTRSGPELVLLGWGPDGVTVASPIAGDTITYQAERLTLNMPSNNAVTINTGPYSQAIIGSTNALGVGTYRVHGMIGVHPGSGGSSTTFAFALGTSGSLAITGMRIYWQETLVQAAAAFGNSGWQTALAPTGFTTSTVASGGTDRCITFDGTVIVSTAGVLNLYAATNNTADTFTVYGYGTYMEINPIGS